MTHLNKYKYVFVFIFFSCWISFSDALSWSVATPIITLGLVSRLHITMHIKRSFCDVFYQPPSPSYPHYYPECVLMATKHHFLAIFFMYNFLVGDFYGKRSLSGLGVPKMDHRVSSYQLTLRIINIRSSRACCYLSFQVQVILIVLLVKALITYRKSGDVVENENKKSVIK